MPTGLTGDEVQFDPHLWVQKRKYILRPETIETFFILNRITGDPIYRTFGWEIYQSIEKYCKTAIAYGEYPDVTNRGTEPLDSMESFFLGETMKYLYLLNDPDTEVDILHKVRIVIVPSMNPSMPILLFR